MTLGSIAAVQGALVDGLFVRVEAKLDHAERYCASNENITAAICDLSAFDVESPL